MGKQKNVQIEGMRGLGCIMILLFHLTYRYCDLYQNGYKLPVFLTPLNYFGTYGVLLFLVISFFFMGNKQKKGNVVKQWWAKYYRLLIPYLISITITFVLEQFMDLGDRAVSFKTYLLNFTMLPNLLGIDSVDGAHWYLGTLVILSAWILIIENYTKNKEIAYLVYLIVVEGFAYFHIAGKIMQPSYAGVAVFAIMLNYFVDNMKTGKDVKFDIAVAVVAVGSVFGHHGVVYAVILILTGALFLLCYFNKLPMLQSKGLIYLGALSYYIYLIHQNVSYMVINEIIKLTDTYHVWYMVACIPVTLALAIVIKVLSERIYLIINSLVVKNKAEA